MVCYDYTQIVYIVCQHRTFSQVRLLTIGRFGLIILEEATSLDTTLRVKWKKKKQELGTEDLTEIFKSFGAIDSCLSKKQGSALISFKTLTGAVSSHLTYCWE
jgi:hypothetical protein